MKTCSEIKVRPILEEDSLFLEACCSTDICNDQKLPLIICDCIPSEADEEVPVLFRSGDNVFELKDEGGHNIYADQIYSRMVLRCTAATDTMHIAVHNKYVGCIGCEKYPLKRTCHYFPKIKLENEVAEEAAPEITEGA